VKKIIIGAFFCLSTLVYLVSGSKPDGFLHVFFLNVGQGDAILVRTPLGKNILVDAGPGNAVLKELKASLPYFDNKIDTAVLTHADRDHIEGFLSVIDRFEINKVYVSGVFKKDFLSEKFLKKVRAKNIPLFIADSSSDTEPENGLLMDFIFPLKKSLTVSSSVNSSSIVLKIIYGETKILLTGDSDISAEKQILAQNVDLKSDILKIGHHGSKTSSSEEFLQAASPKLSVIPVGKGNDYGHPHKETIERLQKINSQIIRTDIEGRIEVVISENRIETIKTQASREISAPRLLNFSSNFSYPRSIYLMSVTTVFPFAISPARIIAAPARMSQLLIS